MDAWGGSWGGAWASSWGETGHNPYYSEFSDYRIPEGDSSEYIEFKLVNQLNAQDNEDVIYILTAVVDKLDG